MERIENAILQCGGRLHRKCYRDLCYAIEIQMEYYHENPQMKVIYADLGSINQNSMSANSKSLEHAISDLWKNGSRDELASYSPRWAYSRPTPHEFLYMLARALLREENQ